MRPLGDTRRHYWLLKRMARRTGVDLAAAYDGGLLDAPDWAAMVQACRSCEWAPGCEAWLARSGASRGAKEDVAPGPCRNRAQLALLRLEEELAR